MILDRSPGSDPLGRLRGLGRGQNSTFSEYGHVSYQIEGNGACSNMVATILAADQTLGGGGQKVKIQLFSDDGHVAYIYIN